MIRGQAETEIVLIPIYPKTNQTLTDVNIITYIFVMSRLYDISFKVTLNINMLNTIDFELERFMIKNEIIKKWRFYNVLAYNCIYMGV